MKFLIGLDNNKQTITLISFKLLDNLIYIHFRYINERK